MRFHRLAIVLMLGLGATSASAKLIEKDVSYSADGQTMKGFLVWDDAHKGLLPGVLVVHEWWGQNEYSRARARLLAGLGYVALALDMYGDGKIAEHPTDARKFATEVRAKSDTVRMRFVAAMKFLESQRKVQRGKIAAIGYCFGGGIVLDMARSGLPLAAVASFHGSLATDAPAQKGRTHARVAVFNGDADGMVNADDIAAFKKEMESAGIDYLFISYPDAKHAFTNPDADELAKRFELPIAYNEKADKASWAELTTFLDATFVEAKKK